MEDRPDVRVIAVPYDSGHRGLRMGAGPEHLLDNGLGGALSPKGSGLAVTTVRHLREPTAEVATAFELHGLVSNQVRRTLADGEFPLVLSGNCNTAAVGTLAGVGWLDAHGEFNTPETTTTGFLDGMGLAVAVGRCWKGMAGSVPELPGRRTTIHLTSWKGNSRNFVLRGFLSSSSVNGGSRPNTSA
jgi:arginase